MTATLERTVPCPAIGLDAPTVELRGVGKVFGRVGDAVTAVANVDLRVAPGEFVCLLGASGCGKTTLLNLIAGLDQPTVGSLTVRTRHPAVVFQEPALLPWLTAGRNIELPLRLRGVGRRARRARAAELLALVRLDGLADKRPHELSGGMRQRVALARALAATQGTPAQGTPAQGNPAQGNPAQGNPAQGNPAQGSGDADGPGLLLMDEPFAALDAITRDVLQGELRRIWQATGSSVLFVTHDVREAVRLGQRVVLLSSRPGTVVQEWAIGDDRARLTDEIVGRLREVISTDGKP